MTEPAAVASEYGVDSNPKPRAAIKVQKIHEWLQAFERAENAKQDSILSERLNKLLEHARRFAPFWSERLTNWERKEGSPDLVLRGLPILTRAELHSHCDALRANFPKRNTMHITEVSSSGSTGTPVRVEILSEAYMPLQFATRLLECRWHKIDVAKPLGQLSAKANDSDRHSLGPPFRWFGTPAIGFQRCTKGRKYEDLYDYCASKNASYLLGSANMLAALARHAIRTGRRDLRPELTLSYASVVNEKTRGGVREGLGAEIVDRYSTEETGIIAVQCPKHDHLHVITPVTFVEIVDENGAPCAVGQLGRVLVTSLQSYAMPLIRYEIGDIAEWGPPCDCGITLPVIKELWGRTRHMITHPDGSTSFTRLFLHEDFSEPENIDEFRFVLHQGTVVAAQIKVREHSPDLKRSVTELVQKKLGYPYPVRVQFADHIDWGESWKKENFSVSDAPPPFEA